MVQTAHYKLLERLPTAGEYSLLYQSTSQAIPEEHAQTILAQSRYGVIVVTQVENLSEAAIGMGRITQDGAGFFYLQDIIVHPDYRFLGIGKHITEHLLSWLKCHEQKISFVGLFAGKDQQNFSEQFGI